ncbi:MAG TPA: FAD-dependent monooxygenase [Tepidisphaeraceae bacterium]|nr:FAD-dependent monooxygenase [Tepidisphaeraceae bacterium]
MIIGGGPAGSVAGIVLAREEIRVTLIEQARFPRDKVCGECVSALGIEVLERAGVAGRIGGAGAVRLNAVGVIPAEGPALVRRLPRVMWGVSRRVMDPILLEAAVEAGVRVRQPVRCEGVGDGRVTCRDLENNRVEELTADWVVVADGKGVGVGGGPPTGDLGVKAHFTSLRGPRDSIDLFGVEGHYVGLAPIDGDRWNVAMNVPAGRVRRLAGDLESLWGSILGENAALAARFVGASRVGPWLASPLPRFGVAKRWPAGVIPVGNAAAALEPIGGEGMGLAMRSAELAAGAIVAAVRAGRAVDVDELRREYRRLWDVRRVACRGVALALSRPGWASGAVELAQANEGLARGVMGLMGKGG